MVKAIAWRFEDGVWGLTEVKRKWTHLLKSWL